MFGQGSLAGKTHALRNTDCDPEYGGERLRNCTESDRYLSSSVDDKANPLTKLTRYKRNAVKQSRSSDRRNALFNSAC